VRKATVNVIKESDCCKGKTDGHGRLSKSVPSSNLSKDSILQRRTTGGNSYIGFLRVERETFGAWDLVGIAANQCWEDSILAL